MDEALDSADRTRHWPSDLPAKLAVEGVVIFQGIPKDAPEQGQRTEWVCAGRLEVGPAQLRERGPEEQRPIYTRAEKEPDHVLPAGLAERGAIRSARLLRRELAKQLALGRVGEPHNSRQRIAGSRARSAKKDRARGQA